MHSQHKSDISYRYTSSVNIDQTYTTDTRRKSAYTSNKLQVHIISQHKPDISYRNSYRYKSIVSIN